MRNRLFLISGLLVFLFVAGWTVHGSINKAERTAWDYHAEYASGITLPNLSVLGSDGWELSAVSCPQENNCVYLFKRPK